MKDPLKRAFFGRVGEYYRSKPRSIQVASGRKHACAEFTPDLLLNFRPIQQRMSRRICIEECCARQKLAQTFYERAFTRGNSAGNPNRRHKKLSAVEAAVSPAKSQKPSHNAPKGSCYRS
jgi:hypothetical protein